MSFPPHEVYSKCLLGVHGYPLWTPQLKTQLRESYRLEGLKIGDVGVVSPNNGGFDVLFNITLPCDEQPYPELIREGFTPVTLNRERDFDTQPDAVSPHGVISSAAMELISREVHNCDQQPSRADYEFNLSMEDGAVLILPEGAESCDLANEKSFLGEAIRHGVDWYECATEAAGRLISNDSLYLITGVHKACSWSLGAAKRSGSNLQNLRSVKFSVGQVHQDRITAGAYLWAAAHGFTGRAGPMYPYEIPNYIRDERLRRGLNQTVFIRGFRITINKILFLKTVSVKTRERTFFGFGTYIDNLLWGRPTEHTPSSGTEDATDNEVEQDSSANHGRFYRDRRMKIDRMPDVSQSFHPGDSINQYLLRKGLLELADFSLEKHLQEVLMDNYRVIVEDGKCCIPSKRVQRTCTPNVLIVGETGVGKSSVINLIAGEKLADVSSSATGCTLDATSYNVVLTDRNGQGHHVRLFDTVGMNESSLSKNDYLVAIEKANALINQLLRTGGIRLLIFCIRGGRITSVTQSNYHLFRDILCQNQVPVAFVITGMENEQPMEGWWTRNAALFEKSNLSCTSHACVTATPGFCNVYAKQYQTSRIAIHDMLLDHMSRTSWKPERAGLLIHLVGKLLWETKLKDRKWHLPGRSGALTVAELARCLDEKCNFSPEEAVGLAGKIWAKRTEDSETDLVKGGC
ncbi:hypothetical protein EV363DRAFT_1562009 [Boletus edulis]|nr:hypothetical protein EV363DRAFT_1562009 [Boletus edulis]